MSTAVLRARRALQAAGLRDGYQLERVSGASNEVWMAGPLVVRISLGAASRRLQHEVAVSRLLPPGVPYPPIVAGGRDEAGEWLILRRVPGTVLARAWPDMTESQRRGAVAHVARILALVHSVRAPYGPWQSPTGFGGFDGVDTPHTLATRHLIELVARASALPHVERALFDDARLLLRHHSDALDDVDRWGLVHADLHFENVLWDGERVSAVLDFEYARIGPADLDLEVMLRFCADPSLTVTSDYAERVNRAQFRGVPGWMRDAYPELFAHPRLADRIALYSMSYDLRLLLARPPTGPPSTLPPYHPYHRIRRLVGGNNPLQALDW